MSLRARAIKSENGEDEERSPLAGSRGGAIDQRRVTDRSMRLRALSALVRVYEKPRLARVTNELELRRGVERAADAMPQPPESLRRAPAPVSRPALDRGRCAPKEAPDAVPALRWAPPRAASGEPMILYLHGGAFVAGSSATHRSLQARLVEEAGAALVAIDYRRAPEHPFPAAQDDAADAYFGLLAEGVAPERIAIVGDSAGGGLVFSTMQTIDARGAPPPAALVAFSPFADLTLTAPSLETNAARDAMLPSHRFAELVDRFLDGADPADPRASPVRAAFRAPPPPALIQVGAREALVDDARAMARVLADAGGAVRLEEWTWAPHAFQFFAPVLPEARRALGTAAAFIKEAVAEAIEQNSR